MSDMTWQNLQNRYTKEDWVKKPSIFAEQAITYFPKQGALLELGAGVGQDSAFFASKGYDVTATDVTTEKLLENKELQQQPHLVDTRQIDLREPLPFDDAAFNIVYAHLSLHYFTNQQTRAIFAEIYRVLAPGGTFAFFTNSTSDPEYGVGTQLEPDYFDVEGVAKRYFTVQAAADYAKDFETVLLDNNGETYKDAAKGVHNLIRYIGVKQR
jgi:SAM-dependent methyltransferase